MEVTMHAAWHEGERRMQELAGSADVLGPAAARILKPFMTEQHRDFFPLLPFVAVGCVDDGGRPWATLLFGAPGLAWSPDPLHLRIDVLPPDADPLHGALVPGAALGLLGIDLSTRRRNRLNGQVAVLDGTGFTVGVQQSFGNCPQYIQQRTTALPGLQPGREPAATGFEGLDDEARQVLSACDTFFVASFARPQDGGLQVDVSHRGGRPGFVRVDADGTVTVADFPGNRFFNTLGNILATGRAGLVVPVFETGDMLLLTGDAAVGVSPAELAEAAQVARAERLWRLRPVRGLWLRGAFAAGFTLAGWSPQSVGSGVWPGGVSA